MARAPFTVLELWTQALSFVYPALCLLCDCPVNKSSPWLCPDCSEKLLVNARERVPCPRCALNSKHTECTCNLVWDHPFEKIISLVDYDETVAAVMKHIKYHGRSALARAVTQMLASSIPDDFFDSVSALIPIPLHPLRHLSRGYNQAAEIAKGIVQVFPQAGYQLRTDIIRRQRYTKTQTKLDRDQRRDNLKEAFSLTATGAQWLPGKTVIVVDDVVTTGATTGVLTDALLAGGASQVRILSLARD